MLDQYLNVIGQTLEKVRETQEKPMQEAADMLAQATVSGQNFFSFGCNHAGLLALELYYRTGGMVNMNPLRGPGLNMEIDPATLGSEMERMRDYGRLLVEHSPVTRGDVVIIHSVSGRNTVTVDAALSARGKGARVIALTNMETTTHVTSRHPSGKNLYEVADVVIDNCGCLGDAAL